MYDKGLSSVIRMFVTVLLFEKASSKKQKKAARKRDMVCSPQYGWTALSQLFSEFVNVGSPTGTFNIPAPPFHGISAYQESTFYQRLA